MITYAPRHGSHAHHAVWHFQNFPDSLGSKELAEMLGVKQANLPALLRAPLENGCLEKTALGNGYAWALGAATVADLPELDWGTKRDPDDSEPEGDAQPDAFSFALWQDGELMINGATQTDSGIVLNVQQTAQLVAYLTSTAAYVEYLGSKQAP